jgi:hypothetical protein
MSIVIALIAVVVVGLLIAKFYPKPTPKVEEKATWDFTPKSEPVVKTPEVIVKAPIAEAPKMDAKPKKKPQPKKKPAKKTNA